MATALWLGRVDACSSLNTEAGKQGRRLSGRDAAYRSRIPFYREGFHTVWDTATKCGEIRKDTKNVHADAPENTNKDLAFPPPPTSAASQQFASFKGEQMCAKYLRAKGPLLGSKA